MKTASFIFFLAAILDFDPRGSGEKICLPSKVSAFMRAKSENLDPPKIITYMDNQLAMTAFGQLTALDEYENIRPYLSKSWSVSDQGRRYLFVLDDRYKFSNGKKITAEDVKFSFMRLFSKELNSGVANYLFGENIVGVREFKAGKAKSIEGI